MFTSVLYITISYLIGSIPIGVILSKLKGKDPRKIGSGNIGATNVMRAAGKTIGIITLLGDITKGFVPTILAVYYEEPKMLITAIGIASFLGHLYPVFLKFKGGKGVATALGVYLAISPLAILINAIIFILVLLKWRYVSLGSLAGTGIMPLTLYILKVPQAYIYLSFIIGVLIFIKHRDNIKRLLEGKENKISF
ncbi:MAG: glycerol-3-phosphate 1-O-acyltransferase PlsY [Proteobacteria bacterium]|jgi:glycerol-3-phosphate acyltransferase PlsY|nr:glycerol-3-phosphate 1-O-acyltransferase PlsY [Pseudomonadota bacterium]